MAEDELCELLVSTIAYLPNEDAARDTIEKFSILDSPAVVAKISKTNEFASYSSYVRNAIEDMTTKEVTDYVISFVDMQYPNIVKEIANDEKMAQWVVDVIDESIRVISDADN